MNVFNMTCEAVEATLPDYLDETLEERVRSSVQQHVGECMRCAALIRDLRNLEREAGALPDLVPARDLWAGIAERIGTPVVALEPMVPRQPDAPAASPSATPVPRVHVLPTRQRRFVPVWMGAAAAALVVVTAGATYLLTARAVGPDGGPVIASVPVTVTEPGPTGLDPDIADSGVSESEPASEATEPGAAPTAPRGRARATEPRSLSRLASTPAQVVYEKEIVMLQSILAWRKAELDPSTAATIEKNLKIIDNAIAESKAALRRDPASSMLSDQLSHTLDKKVELLRTAAMLPART